MSEIGTTSRLIQLQLGLELDTEHIIYEICVDIALITLLLDPRRIETLRLP